jgi:hypothetical protein
MGSAHSVMHLITMFVFVCLATLVMAITAIVHHYTMKQVMECHQFLVAYLESVGVHLDMSFRTTLVCGKRDKRLKKQQMEMKRVMTIFIVYDKLM